MGWPLFLQSLDSVLQASNALVYCFYALKFHRGDKEIEVRRAGG